MKLDKVLAKLRHIYLDTAPIIYYVEENLSYIAKMESIIDSIENKPIMAYSSVITLTEVLNHPIKQGNTKLEQQYRDILLHTKGFQLLTVTSRIAEIAAKLRATYNLRTPDALHVATAIENNCDAFLTNDMGIKRVTEIQILVLDELELSDNS